ncbi:MAG: cyclase family protein [Alphaproteobacteria bacterium]|nr:cyclase family protein [Alphaproteobacteria bacterium]
MTVIRSIALTIAALSATAAFAADNWYPSKYGAADTIGAANNLSPAASLAAAKLVKLGKVYSLGVVTGRDTPAYPPRTYQIVITQSNDGTGQLLGSNQATANDDILMSYVGIGSQLDGLGHVGVNHLYYNGKHAKDFVAPDGLKKYGTESVPPIATRGVLLDMAKLLKAKQLPAGRVFNRAEIEAAEKAAGVTIGKGDVVLFHTGWQSLATTNKTKFMGGEPGLGKEGAALLAARGVVAVGADTWAVEAIPFEIKTEAFPVHQILLARNGVYILENMNTAALAADGATEFLFVLGQPKFQGAVQATINPVAIR